MTKKYQKIEFDTSTLAAPEQVCVAMEEMAADLQRNPRLDDDYDERPIRLGDTNLDEATYRARQPGSGEHDDRARSGRR